MTLPVLMRGGSLYIQEWTMQILRLIFVNVTLPSSIKLFVPVIVRGAVIIPSRLNANARLLVAHESGSSNTRGDQEAHVLPDMRS